MESFAGLVSSYWRGRLFGFKQILSLPHSFWQCNDSPRGSFSTVSSLIPEQIHVWLTQWHWTGPAVTTPVPLPVLVHLSFVVTLPASYGVHGWIGSYLTTPDQLIERQISCNGEIVMTEKTVFSVISRCHWGTRWRYWGKALALEDRIYGVTPKISNRGF